MKEIIEPVDTKLIEAELTAERFVRSTNNAGNELYIFEGGDAPNLMREVGRLREWSFRSAGGGTGAEIDVDELDVCAGGYKQLIVWDPAEKDIVGGYRYTHSGRFGTSKELMSSRHYFNFSEDFESKYMPYMIELGRSFVQPKYQMTGRSGKGLYALDNLWDGLGALIVLKPHIKYFFGKVTMYNSYNVEARNLLFYFFDKYFKDTENLVVPIQPVEVNIDREKMSKIFVGDSFKDDYKILGQEVKELGERIPPLINSYMNLSPSMKVFGTCINPDFGEVVETGIMITIPDIYQHKIERHISTFIQRFRTVRQSAQKEKQKKDKGSKKKRGRAKKSK